MTAPDTPAIVERLRERVTIGFHDDGYASIGIDKDGNTAWASRASTPMTRLANRDGPEAADAIEALLEALESVLSQFVDPQQGLDQFDSAIVRKAIERANSAIEKATGTQPNRADRLHAVADTIATLLEALESAARTLNNIAMIANEGSAIRLQAEAEIGAIEIAIAKARGQ